MPIAIDLDLIADLIEENGAGLAMYFAAQALLLAIMIGVAVRRRLRRGPVERFLRRRQGFGV